MPPPPRHAHTIDPVYADPVLRASSPTDSINTEYVPDETPLEQLNYSQAEFARFVEDGLGLGRSTWADVEPPRQILLPKPTDQKEEQMLFNHVMRNLREKVKELEEEDHFERIRYPGNTPGPSLYASIPSSKDINALMKGYMPSATSNTVARSQVLTSNGTTNASSGSSFETGVTSVATLRTATTSGAAAATVNGKGKGSVNTNVDLSPNLNLRTRTRSRARAGGAANTNGLPSNGSGGTTGRRQGPVLGLGLGLGEVPKGMGGRF